MKHTLILLIAMIVVITGCKSGEQDKKLQGSNSSKSTLFTMLSSEESGFYFLNEVNQTEDVNVLSYENFYNGGGVGIGDINNDGLPDIFMTGNLFGGRLYLNLGDLKFEQISEKANIFIGGFTTDVSFVDINGDGYQDIYLSRSLSEEPENRKNVLYINNKDNTFTNRAEEYGIADQGYSNQSVFFDYDNDGDLDLYVMNHRSDFENAQTIFDAKSTKGNITPSHQFWNKDYADRIYQNNGDGTFTDATSKSGIVNNDFSLSAVASDLNKDGFTDIYISNDFTSKDHAYINQGDGSFKDQIESMFAHIPKSAMGLDIADYNNDGNLDLFNLDMTPEGNYRQKQMKNSNLYDKYHLAVDYGFYHQISRNMLQLNNGDGTFSEIGQLANIAYTDWSWSALFADFDNDGWQDLFISNGHFKDITDLDYLKYKSVEEVDRAGGSDHVNRIDLINLMTSTKIPNYAFQNNGNLGFTNKTKDWGLDTPSFSNGTAYADLDLDGDLDIIVNNYNQEAFLYRNNSRENGGGNYLSISLNGPNGNPQGFGAKVKVTTGKGEQIRECTPYRGFESSVDQTIHFGLGELSEVQKIEVEWPNGLKEIISNVNVNQLLKIDIKNAKIPVDLNKGNQKQWINSLANRSSFRHTENSFIDFKQEPLLEHMLSNRGPVIASADVNGDGLKDLYIGGSAGFAGQILLQNAAGAFALKGNSDFNADKKHEDGGCAFIDVNGDNNLDLYVSSGSNEFPQGDIYQDRIYINDGKGNFKRDVSSLPKMTTSTSTVLNFDWDGDGDDDLFIGGFAKYNSYPLCEKSWLLRNDSGKFSDISDKLPENGKLGIVNDAMMLSSNELIVVGEWMNISRLIKTGKNAYKLSKNDGLQRTGGWWNTVEAADLDNDGDLDFVVGNRGTNSMFKADKEHPAKIYWGDFDDNGDLDAIPSYYYFADADYFPRHGLDQLFMQMKGVRKIFPDYTSYSRAPLATIVPKRDNFLTTELFESVFVENLGNGQFKVHELPIEAQFSYTRSVLVKDVNADGWKDLILVGNNYGVDIEMGRSDASNGILLLNKKGKFEASPYMQSGFRTGHKDARKLIDLGKNIFAIANNNAELQFYRFNR